MSASWGTTNDDAVRNTMDLSKYLDSVSFLDCQGGTTHQLTLLPDGKVQIEMATVTAVVDPVSRSVLRPPGFRVPDQIMDQAVTLART